MSYHPIFNNAMNATTLVRQKSSRRRKRTPKSDHGKILKLAGEVSKLKKVVNDTEIKNDYINFDQTQIDYNGSITTPVNAITQGVDVDARIGRSIQCHGIDFRYRVEQNTTAQNSIRVIVVLDKDASLTQTADLLYNGLAGFTVGSRRAPLSFYNRNNRSQFTILYDKIHDFDQVTGDCQAYERVKLKTKHKTTFVDNSNVIAENALRVFAISDQAPAAGTRPTLEWAMSYYYTDK